MKKLIVIVAGLIVIFVVLRRLGPEVRERAVAKCQEMMTSHRKDEGARLPDPDAAAEDARTPAVV
jgi:hypothetical protein